MSNRQKMVVALACATVAALLLGLFLQRSATAAERSQRSLLRRYGKETVQVLVARRDLSSGTLLDSKALKAQSWPAVLLPEGALLERDRAALLGKRTTAWVARGEPVLRKRVLQAEKSLDGLSAGLSAVTISTDAVHALGGEVSDGMRVTLMGAGVSGVVAPLATNIEVLSSSTSVRDRKAEAASSSTSGLGLFGAGATSDISWVTLAVPTPQAAQVISAAQAGKLWLVLQGGEAR
ncbi:MAG: Flp pilus assembly protein CpaB [Actinomycetia bacterium]|nr:Flp pilus assembly protein CpaB [Actinomycetes bacterium]